MNPKEQFRILSMFVYRYMVLVFCFVCFIGGIMIYLIYDPELSFFDKDNHVVIEQENIDEDEDKIENGIHIRTGLIEGKGLMAVVNNCTNCHSSKIITQNRMTKERWKETIVWMQETQNLWDLGENEDVIINYLVTYYPVAKKGRRQNLTNIEWYELESE